MTGFTRVQTFRNLMMVMIIWTAIWMNGTAQILQTPVNTALGGGGTAYTTGYESLFINPANLFIQEKTYRLQISAITVGSYITSPVKNQKVYKFGKQFLEETEGYQPFSYSDEEIDHQNLLSRNYANGRLLSEHQSKGEIHWFGMHWSGPERSYALAIRSRFANRYTAGRAFYDQDPVEHAGSRIFNRSLSHQYQSLHEVSFGYAESFDFINGLIPRLSQLVIGISPKLVAGGAYLNMTSQDIYSSDSPFTEMQHERTYEHISTGSFTRMHQRFAMQQNPFEPSTGRIDLFRPTGIGAGLDVGLTYLITLGDDLSVIRDANPGTRKSLRLSFSITDIGVIRYYKDPESHTLDTNRTAEANMPDSADRVYRGRPGEHLDFLSQYDVHPLSEPATKSDDSFDILLPTALQGGALLQMNRLKIMADMSLGLTRNAFNTTRLITYVGTEIRPFPFLPLRAGTRITRNQPDYYSIGAGIDTRYAEFSAAIQFRSRSIGPTSEISGVSLGTLKIYIP